MHGIEVPDCVIPNGNEDTILPFEDGYYGGTESEEIATWNSGCADTDEEMSDAEEAERNQCNDYSADVNMC